MQEHYFELAVQVSSHHSLFSDFLADTLPVGFEEIDDGLYNVYYCDFLLGRFFEEIHRMKDVIKRLPMRQRIVKESYPGT